MTANEIAQMVRTEPYHTNLNRNVIADFIDQQADRIGVLEANHKIQVNINEKALQYIAELEKEAEECWCQGHSYEYLRAKNRLPQTKPLSDEEIIKVNEDIGTCWDVPHRFAIQIARAIEERHGIK